MKKIFLALFSIAITASSCEAQPKVKTIVNDANAVKRDVGSFTGISVSNAIQVYLSQGDECAVAVSCSDGDKINEVMTEVSNGVLNIKVDQGFWDKVSGGNMKVKAYVTIKNISSIKLSGASTLKINETITANDLSIKLSGASTLKGNIKASDFTAYLSGASDMKISGTANKTLLDCSGASDFKTFDFVVDKCKIVSSGASSVSISVNKDLDVDASGASDVKYGGNPTNVNIDKGGASEVKKRN